MNDELDKALAGEDRPEEPWCPEGDNAAAYRDIAVWAEERVEILAAAVRELRETVKAREEEIAAITLALRNAQLDVAALKHRLDYLGMSYYPYETVNPSLDQALNEGDGSYKP